MRGFPPTRLPARTLIPLVGAVAAGLVAVPLALAGSGSIVLAPDAVGAVTHDCSSGRVVGAIGYKTVVHPGRGPGLVPRAARRVHGGSSRSKAWNIGSSDGALWTYSYCRRGAAAVAVAAERTVPPINAAPNGRSLKARCPHGMLAAFGGFAVSPARSTGDSPGMLVTTSKRSAPGVWKVSAIDGHNTGSPGTLRAFAYCTRGRHPARALRARTTVPGQAKGTVIVRCPRGTRALAGGFAGEVDDPKHGGPGIPVFQSRRTSHHGWVASGFNAGGTAGTLRVIAYCG